jgi:hypothetical protein
MVQIFLNFLRKKHKINIKIILFCFSCTFFSLGGQLQQGPLKPVWLVIQIPQQGFMWLAGEEFTGNCDTVAEDDWKKYPADDFDMLICADGPAGSGRYWTISLAIKSKTDSIPGRGCCFTTSTVGWRTLPQPADFSLSWAEDRDSDGKPELIIWDSFPLSEEATMAEYGLIGWIYQIDQSGLCTIDWNLSRKSAVQIAALYNRPAAGEDQLRSNLQHLAAEALLSFAYGRYTAEEQ